MEWGIGFCLWPKEDRDYRLWGWGDVEVKLNAVGSLRSGSSLVQMLLALAEWFCDTLDLP
jgi:hypothetical protein